MIIIGGLADIPEPALDDRTPLMIADTPALDALANCGCCGLIPGVDEYTELSQASAILSLLGHDMSRGIPDYKTLSDFGHGRPFDMDDLRFFVIPKFSGHGVTVTDSDLARGIGMMALLRPVFTVDPSALQASTNPCGTLTDKAKAAITASESFDFVVVYVDSPLQASLAGDPDAKADAIERIDKELIAPVADYVWNAKEQMNLVVCSDAIASWRNRDIVRGDIPAVVYFNDDLPYDTKRFDEVSVAEGPLSAPGQGDLMKMLISFEPLPETDNK